MTDSDDAWLAYRAQQEPKPDNKDKLLRLVTVVDDIGRIKALIASSPPDYPGLPALREYLVDLEARAAREASDYEKGNRE